MRITLFIVSIILILFTPVVAIFFDAKAGVSEGHGFSIPFWPFVLAIAVIVNPLIHDLVKIYFRTRVKIAKAENGEDARAINPTPPVPGKPPTDIAKG